jgi:outer membrane protein
MSPRYNLNSQRSARVSLENSFLSYKNQIQGIVQNIESLYLSLISAREQLEIQRRNLQLSETTYNETTARVNVGTQTELQRIQAEITLLNARDNFSNTERSLIAAEDALRTALGGGDYDVGIIPTDPIADFDGQLPNAEESFQLALANGTDYQIALKNLENTEAAAYVAEVNARPNISLSGNIALYGSDTDFSPAWNDIGRRDNYAWGVNLGANVSLPLRNERSNARTARNNLTSAQIQLEQLRNQIYTNVRSQIRSITQNYQSAQLAVQQVDLSQRNYDAENARYQQGLTTYRDLQTAQNNLESARTALLNRRIALRNALNSLSRIEGRTLDRFGITVPTE